MAGAANGLRSKLQTDGEANTGNQLTEGLGTMLHMPVPGCKSFEASIYNRVVRGLVKENRSHHVFDDYWADIQRQDVEARDETEAREILKRRFRPEDGFVIAGLEPAVAC